MIKSYVVSSEKAGLFSANLKFRHLGLGFLWAWIYCSWMSPAVFPESAGLTVNGDVSWIISAAFVVLSLFTMPFLFKRDIISVGWVRVMAPLGVTLGSLAMAQGPIFGTAIPLVSFIGSALTGIASGCLWIMWGEFFGAVNLEITHSSLPLSVTPPLVCMLLTPVLNGSFAAVAVCCLPLFSGICLAFSVRDQPQCLDVGNEPAITRTRPDRACLRDFFKLGLATVAIYTAISFCWSSLRWEVGFTWGAWFYVVYTIGALAAICVAFVTLFFARSTDVFSLYRWLIPLALLAFAALSFQSLVGSMVAFCLITVVQYGFDIVVWVYFAGIINVGKCSGRMATGINRGLVQLAVVLGSVIGIAAPQWIGSGAIEFSSLLLIIMAVMVAAVLAVFPYKDSDEPPCCGDASEGMTEDSKESVPATCEDLAKGCSLTKREAEVLLLLAQGRSIPFIANSLYISKNTVDSHVKNIYRKLDVHSRQELLDRVQSTKTPD